MEHKISRGAKVRDVIISKGYTLKSIGQKLKKSRGAISLWVRNEDLDYKYIKMIGDAINHDFSAEFPEMKTSKPWLSIDEKEKRISELEDQLRFWTQEAYRASVKIRELEEENQKLKQFQIAAEESVAYKKKGA